MAINEDLSKRLSELYRCIDDLKTSTSEDPDQIKKILSSTLEELEMSIEELSTAEEELCQQNEELTSANEALLESEARYRSLAENVSSVLMRYDRGLRVVYLSPQAEKFTGIPIDKFIGRTNREVGMPEDLCDLWENAIERVFQTGDNQDLEFYLPAADGSDLKTFYLKITPEFAADGATVQCVLGISTEITDRKEIEDGLTRQAGLIDLSPDGIMVCQLDGTITFWSQGAQSLYGWTKQEAIGQQSHILFKTQFPQLLEQIVEQVRETGIWSGELIHRTKDGMQIIVQSRWLGRFDDQHNMKEILESNVDITERKQAERTLREARDYLENLIDYANAPIIVWDPAFKISRFNHAFESLTGLAAGEVLGKSLGILFPDDSKDESLSHINRTLSGEHWEIVEIPILRTDGSIRTVLWNSATIYAEDGTTVVATIAQGQDITERKQAEIELRKSKDELELRVQDRTAELVRAKEIAESAVEAKAAFLANMSHELRTPMNAVIGFSSLLLDEDLTPNQRDYIERIKIGGESLLAIISDILDFSKTEKEKIKLEYQPLSLRHNVEESLSMVAVQAEKKGLNLASTISYGTPDTIVGDPGRLRQILVNLLSNAVKFTDVGEVSISISSKVTDGKRHRFLFTVTDTGIGIPHGKMDRLFKPFSQLEYTLSRKRDGAGLGLAISKRLVELMGGEIWAKSELGKGSTFYFTIEAEVAHGLPIRSETKDKSIENLAEKYPLCILVAEDNPSNQRVLVEMLKRMGYKADAVADGREVIESLERRPYDLIFMDVKMPETDGLEATRQIRRRWPDNGPKIVAITAYALDGDREKCLDAGMDGYIAKPVLKGELAEVLKRWSLEAQ